MGFVEETHREWQPLRIAELTTRVGERIEVVTDLLDVRTRRPALLGLERQEIDQGRLSAFDLRGQHRLLADERVDEPIERRHHRARQVEPGQRVLGCPETPGERGVEQQRGGWRQRERNEGRDLLAGNGGALVSPRDTLAHRPGSSRNDIVPVLGR